MAPATTAERPPPVPRLGSTSRFMPDSLAANASPSFCIVANAIPVPPMRSRAGSCDAAGRGLAAELRTSTPRRKNKPHSEGPSRSEWLADHGPLERLGEGAVEVG